MGCTRKCRPFMIWYAWIMCRCSALLLMFLSSITCMKEHIATIGDVLNLKGHGYWSGRKCIGNVRACALVH